jgi:hypothetical protein
MLNKLFHGFLVVLFAAGIAIIFYAMAKNHFWHWGFFSLIGLFLLGIVISVQGIRGRWR